MIAVCIILIILLLLFIVIIVPHKVRLQANSDENGFRANAFILSVFRAYIFTENTKIILQIYAFGIRVINSRLKRKPGKNNTALLVKSADVYDIKIDAHYGMNNPFMTGLASGALGIATSFIRPDEINIYPDFFSGKSYLKISATAEIDLGNTLLNFAKNKRNETRRKSEWIKT